ncbi:thioredoxin-related protein [Micromonas pusilla CCMP1545]|uniref:Thioredoxin-related protein n=1 Tax=Micromonas pusilla (strain CCMP1545) TaxID=564608 RepID=C1MPX5_MICPC|nr:thioredoxin-related protein [Micromonas pusilla CCMP1545]EEH57613.1 thioredoxin-related protein [Micromonas pusilla CCMP1545]|eukprot:XP_003057662.1 thioredoxin-related protein [Micromonas pusilla CCMP1545]
MQAIASARVSASTARDRSVSVAAGSRRGVVATFAPARRTREASRASRLVVNAGNVQQVNKDELEKVMEDRSTPLIIDFFATWCGPCVLLASELEKVKEELGDSVRIVKVDTDKEEELSSQLQIQGLPTLVFVGTDKTKPALRTEGMLPAEMVKNIIANEL